MELLEAWIHPKLLFEPPPRWPPLAHLTLYELVCLLESSGFSWMLLPRRQVARQALAYQASNPQSPKVWCTRKAPVQKAVQRFYLLALATAAEKRSEALVLHGMPEAYYRSVLGLERRRCRPDVACTGNALLLADDGEPLEDDEDQPPPARRCRRPRDESDATLDVYAEVFDDNVVDAIADAEESVDGESSDSSTADVDQSGPAREEVATHREQDADCVWAPPLAEPPLAALMGERSDMVPVAARIRDPSVLNHNWGAFRFTLKALRSSTGHPGFAWQCACRYHRKNDRTGCKKSIAVPGGPEEWEAQSSKVLQRLRFWATRACDFHFQRHHVAFDPDPELLPPWEVIEAQRIDEPPPEPPFPDDGHPEQSSSNSTSSSSSESSSSSSS